MTNEEKIRLDALCERIIGAAIEVHKHMGPGLLERVYQRCLEFEFLSSGLSFTPQYKIDLTYKGKALDYDFYADFLVEDSVIVEIKAVNDLLPVCKAQTISYLKLADKKAGLLINFHVSLLYKGVKRFNIYDDGIAVEESMEQPN